MKVRPRPVNNFHTTSYPGAEQCSAFITRRHVVQRRVGSDILLFFRHKRTAASRSQHPRPVRSVGRTAHGQAEDVGNIMPGLINPRR